MEMGIKSIFFEGKRSDVIKAAWENMFAEAIEHQPSVLLFDDLDYIIQAPTNEQQLRGEESGIIKMAECTYACMPVIYFIIN